MRTKYVPLLDIAPLEIIDKEDDEDFINAAAAAVENINQIDLVIHIIHHDIIYQYWSLKSEGDSGQLNSSACHHQHHRDSHHLRDGDDDEEMIMINCQPANTPLVLGKLLVDQGVFASYDNDQIQDDAVNADDEDHADNNDDDYYIMSLLHDMDVLYESERIHTYEHLQEMKRCITQRISEAKPAVLIAKPKRVRIRVHLGTILKRYYANSAAANSAAAQGAIELRIRDELSALSDHLPSQQPRSPATPQSYEIKPASRSSKEALKTKIFEKGDLISSSSSCPVCWIEFRVGVDEIMIMPCSHVFHSTCLWDWLLKRNTCPLCRYELPTRQLPSSRWNRLPTRQLPSSPTRQLPSSNCFTIRWKQRRSQPRPPLKF